MTVDEGQQTIVGEFSQLPDPLDTYQHLVRAGETLAAAEGTLRTDGNALPGCQSQVWIAARVEDGGVVFSGDSDSRVIRGVLALLFRVLDGRSPAEIAGADLYFLREIGVSTHLSPARANGVSLIVRRVQTLAQGLAPPGSGPAAA